MSVPGVPNGLPLGARSSRAAITTFLQDLERGDPAGMGQLMTPAAQRNETDVEGGLLPTPPDLTSFIIRSVVRENPRSNASPAGSIASLRYTVALTPSAGFSNDDTSGSAYGILVSETQDKRWLVAELGGGG
jgi:hypothetical protein